MTDDRAARLAEIEKRMREAAMEPWSFSAQSPGQPGHLSIGQVWDRDGKVLADVEPTEDRKYANRTGGFIAHARSDIPWLLSELSRLEVEEVRLTLDFRTQQTLIETLERDLQIECEIRAGYYEEIKTLERSLAEAKEREAALRGRVPMLRVCLSTIETLARDGSRGEAHKLLNTIAKEARHSLNRDDSRVGAADPASLMPDLQSQLAEARNKALESAADILELKALSFASTERDRRIFKEAWGAIRALRTDRSDGNG